MEGVGGAWVSSLSPLARRGRMSRTDTKSDTPASSAHCTCLWPLRMHGTDIRLLASAAREEEEEEQEEGEEEAASCEEQEQDDEKDADFFTHFVEAFRWRLFSGQEQEEAVEEVVEVGVGSLLLVDPLLLVLGPRGPRGAGGVHGTSPTSSSCRMTRWNVSEASGMEAPRGLVRRTRVQSTSPSPSPSPSPSSSPFESAPVSSRGSGPERPRSSSRVKDAEELLERISPSPWRRVTGSQVGAMTGSKVGGMPASTPLSRELQAAGQESWDKLDVAAARKIRVSLPIQPAVSLVFAGQSSQRNRLANDER